MGIEAGVEARCEEAISHCAALPLFHFILVSTHTTWWLLSWPG
jgi:hypothetical protein